MSKVSDDFDKVKHIGNDLISDYLTDGIEYLMVNEHLWDLDVPEDEIDNLTKKVFEYVNSTLDTLAQRFEDDDS